MCVISILYLSLCNSITLHIDENVMHELHFCSPVNITVFLVCTLQKTVYGANVVIFEGILAFANKELLKVSLKLILSCRTLDKSQPSPLNAVCDFTKVFQEKIGGDEQLKTEILSMMGVIKQREMNGGVVKDEVR